MKKLKKQSAPLTITDFIGPVCLPTLLYLPILIGLLVLVSACSTQKIQEHTDGPTFVQEKSETTKPPLTAKENSQKAEKNTEASAEYHFSMAEAYVADGNTDRAIEEFKLTLMFDPKSSLAYTRLAMEYIKKDMLSAATETCKEALKLNPNFVDARMILAGLYSAIHNKTEALNEYEKVLKLKPNSEEAAIYKTQLLIETDQEEKATDYLRGFVKHNPESVLGWYYLGRIAQEKVRVEEENIKSEEEGEQTSAKVAKEESKRNFSSEALAYYQRALTYVDEAEKCYKKALEIKPGFTQAALALGFLYEDINMNSRAIPVYKTIFEENHDTAAANRIVTIYLKEERYKEAIPYLQSIEAADPDDMNTRVKEGLVEMELKQYDKAIAIFKGILDKKPDSERIHYYLGSLYEEIKECKSAVSEFKKIEATSKLYSDSALHAAYLLKQCDSLAAATAFMHEAVSKAPNILNFYIFEASLAEEAKNLPQAIVVLEKAQVKFPEDEKLLYYLGSLYDRQGNIDKSIENMEVLLKLNPNNVDALNYLGYTWTTQGIRLNDAEVLLKKALALKPDNGYIQDSWGWFLFVRGKIGDAIVSLEKAVQMQPKEATILEHLGDAYLRKNLRQKALRRYEDAIKYAEDVSMKQKLEAKMKNLETELASGKQNENNRTPAEADKN